MVAVTEERVTTGRPGIGVVAEHLRLIHKHKTENERTLTENGVGFETY